MKSPVLSTVKLSFYTLLGASLALSQRSFADVIKANNSTTLTNGSCWLGGVAPGTSDIVIFSNNLTLGTFSNPNNPAPLTGNLSILGIRVAGPVLGQADGENGITISNASSANKITIGTSGIDLSATNAVPLEMESQIALGASQTWNVSDASAHITNPVPVLPLPATQNHSDRYTAFDDNEDEDLYFNAQVVGTSFNLGGFTLTLTNTGTTAIDQGYTIANGTINVTQGTLAIQGGKSRQTTISNNVSINVSSGATLRLQTTSGAIVSSAAITLADGSLLNLTAAGTQGTGTVSNSITVTGNATLSQTQNPIVGGDNSITNVVAAGLIGAPGTTLNLVPSQSGSATAVLELSGNNSGFDGEININATSGIRPVLLSSANAGSANAIWNISASNVLQIGGVAVQLGELDGAGTISNSTASSTASLNVGTGNFSGVIANAGTAVMALNKISSSTFTLAGTNTYTGATAVSNGTLMVNGSITSPVTVYTGGTLGGTGILRSNLLGNAGGTVAPGGAATTGVLTVSGAITNKGAMLMKLDRDTLPTSDELVSAKTLTVSGALTVNNIGSAPQLNDSYTLFSATSYSGSFSSITLPTLAPGLAWNTSSLLSNGTISVVALPAIGSLTPLNPTVECSGSQSFSVTATGQTPLSYQWSVNGTPVNGQTGTNFSLLNIHFPSPILVTVTVTNAYGSVASNSLVAVQDTTPPVITLLGANPMTVECHGTFTDPGATANDACAGSVTVQVSGSVDPNTSGSYQLTYTANDGNGNISTATRTVNVTDTTAPLITYSFTNLVLAAGTNCSALMPDVTGTNYVIASDACSGTNLIITQVPTNLTVLPEGTNTVIISVADQSGNTTYSTNTIVVQDETAPVITLNGLASMNVECHGAFTDPGASATDNCNLASLTTNGIVDPTSPGIYTITYVATDATGNSATNVRTVTVVDTTPPVVTLIGPSSMTNWVGSVFVDPGATANDACAGPLPVIVIGTVNTSVAGVYTLQYMTVDPSDNASTNTRTVHIIAPLPPVISGGTMLSNGHFQLSFTGPQGQTYKVMKDSNPAQPGSWSMAASGTFGTGPVVYTDTNMATLPACFFRVISP